MFSKFINVGTDDNPKWKLAKPNEIMMKVKKEEINNDIFNYIENKKKEANGTFEMMQVDKETGEKTYIHNCFIKSILQYRYKRKGKRWIKKAKTIGLTISGEIGSDKE